MNLAQQLRQITDSKSKEEIVKLSQSIINEIYERAKVAAEMGSSSCELYSNILFRDSVAETVKTELAKQGFTVLISEDESYFKHSGKKTIYVEVSW